MTPARIVVVVDERVLADDLQRALQRLGYAVIVVAHASEQAAQQIAATQPDLVLAALHDHGIGVVAQLQHQCGVPVILVAAASDATLLAQAQQQELSYVTKPLADRELQIIVEAALQRHALEMTLKRVERWLANTLTSIGDAVIATDVHGNVTFVNQIAEQITGWRQVNAIGKHITEIFNVVDGDAHQPLEDPVAHVLRDGVLIGLDRNTWLARPDGGMIQIDESAAPIRNDDNTISGVVIVFRDITRRLETEQPMHYFALHDTLTDLPNRTLFMNQLEHAVERVKRQSNYLCAVLFMDLDRFKVVNDSLGHLTGDELLKGIARRLEGCVRLSDTVARLGGDEFMILLDGISGIEQALFVAKRVIRELAAPFIINGHEIFTGTSIGIVIGDPQHTQTDDMLRNADIALYRAKAQGRGTYAVFDTAMHDHVMAQMQLETALRRAVERQEFRVYYQPIMSLEGGHLRGFEALVRWQHPELGLVAPAEFIPILEETGLIYPVGCFVLRESCRQLSVWQRSYPHMPMTMSVNLSGKQILHPDIGTFIREVLDETGVQGHNLQLELTESVLFDGETVHASLQRIRAMGVQLSIDDFGTGYSSLSVLHRFPISTLKIDQTFTQTLGRVGAHSGIVRTIVHLARDLAMNVVAEGVETAEHAAQLTIMGCDYGQGYWFARPLESSAAEAFLMAR